MAVTKTWNDEKEDATLNDTRVETKYDSSSSPQNTEFDSLNSVNSRWPLDEQKKIMRRVDYRLIPICGFMYCVSLLDRTNLSNAAIAGMTIELKLARPGPDRYSIITLIFFITYTLFQAPATVLCRKIGPRVFLSTICLAWGVVMIGFGFVKSWEPLVALRAILGVLEAGFFPGVVFLLSTWYTRYEVGKRYAFFYLIGSVTAAFGGILAFGLMQMKGLAGYAGWRWIFIIEGILTCIIAALGFLLLPAFPDKIHSRSLRFMKENQLNCVLARVNADRGDAELVKFDLKLWLRSGADWKIWAYGLIFGCVTTVSYALAYFLPQILNLGLGFDVGTSQCLQAPPYVFAGLVMLVQGWWGDHFHLRGPAVVLNAIMSVVGLALVGFHANPKIRYFGVFLAVAGANANVPVVMAYQANNIRGQWKRAFCSATLVGFGAIGGIVGSTVFRAKDGPGYRPGISVAMGAQVLVVFVVGVLTLEIRRQNGMADRGEKVLEDGNASFRYTL